MAILMSVFTGIPIRFLRQKQYTTDDTLSFAESVSAFSSKYNDYEEAFAENPDNIGLSTKRLIVKTTKELISNNAIDSIFGLDYQIFQYSDNESLSKDTKLFSDKGLDFCNDSIISAADLSSGVLDDSVDLWSYEHLDIDNIVQCYSENNCDEIVVGVLDSGIEESHELFADRLLPNNLNFSSSGEENNSSDDFGHGTSVSGVIAIATPSNVKIKPYKLLNKFGIGTVAQFIAAAEYILSEKDKPDILNLSFGAYNFEGADLQAELCEQLVDAGITVVLSSGNDNLPIKYLSPAGADTAITVGAYNSDYQICSFSNYGEEIDVAAPGKNIFTARLGNNYDSVSGTSMAAPFVASACAYVLMNSPKSTPAEIKKEIELNSIYMGEDEKAYFGSGMLSIANVVNQNETTVHPDLKETIYTESQTLSFSNIPDDAELIYTTDLSVPASDNGFVYSEPIAIDNDVHINYAVLDNDKYISDIKSCSYTVQHYSDESDFKISLLGVITSYSSDKKNIVVPDKINGITPVEVGKNAFSDSEVTSVILPDTVKKINYGFENLTTLKHIVAKGVTTLTNAFSGCTNLRDEVMPNVSSAGAAFKNCSMLHSIDFEESLSKISGSDFEGTGLVSLNIPNVSRSLIGDKVFASSTLIKINAPQLKKIGDYDFAYCNYLQVMNTPSVTSLGSHCFDGCAMLTEFDASNIDTLSSEALSFCYIDTFDAPKVKVINLLDKYLTYSYIRVLKLPNITGVIDPKCLDGSYVEELYLDNITWMSAAFKASTHLKVLYMPKCTNFVDTKTESTIHGNKQSPLQVLWIPSCKDLTYDCVDLKMLFAPSLTKLNITNMSDSSIVLTEKLKTISVSMANGGSCRIYAPEGSAASNYAIQNHMQLVNNENAIHIHSHNGSSASYVVENRTFDFNYFNYAGSMQYGYLYDYAENADLSSKSKSVEVDFKRNTDDKNMTLNFEDLPDVDNQSDITVRAYMDIDGVRFYSPVVSRKIDFSKCCDEHIKVSVIGADDDCFVYRCGVCDTVFSVPACEVMAMWDIAFIHDYVNDNSPKEDYYLDVACDGVINAKDYALILKTESIG